MDVPEPKIPERNGVARPRSGVAGNGGAVWREVTVAAAPEQVELVADLLFEAGASGLEELPPLGDGRVELRAYLPAESPRFPAEALAERGGTLTATRAIADCDWDSLWRQGLEPVPLGARLVVTPGGTEPPTGRIVLHLDPGGAFGTGLHTSTALAAAALEAAVLERLGPRNAGAAPPSVLDVGTGSGILAIAACLLGARPVLAIDNYPGAVVEARLNAEKNGCREGLAVSGRPLHEVEARFDIVVANIDAPELAELVPELVSRVAPGGTLLLGGLRVHESVPEPAKLERSAVRTDSGWKLEIWNKTDR